MRNLLILLSIIPLLFIPLSSYSATPTSANKKNNKIIQKFINIDIRKLIDAIAKITKKNFAIDPQVRGNVTLIAESGIKPNALYRSFLSLLSLHGYVAVGDGDIIKIVPQAKARISMNSPHSSKWDTQVVTIKGVEANFAINLLRPLLTPGAQISVLNNTDKIIITDSVDKIKHIKNVIEKISSTTVTNYEMIKLKFSASKEMFDRIKRINPVLAKRIVADEKSNSLIITGDDNKKDEIRNIILDLDVQSPSSTSGLEVIYLIHADAKTLAPVIRKILTNENVVSNLASDTKTVQQSVPPNLRQPNISITNNNTNTKKNNKVSVEADERLNALIISGPTSGLKAAKIAIDKLDVKRAQVLIEAVIAELSTTGGINLGVDWASMNSSGVAALNLQGNLKILLLMKVILPIRLMHCLME